MRKPFIVALLASLVPTPVPAASAADAPAPVTVPIGHLFDNDGIDTASDRTGNFDGSGYAFPAEGLPSGQVTADGVPYLFPGNSQTKNNNAVATGQRIELPKGRYLTAHFLVASSYGATGGTATVHYADGSSTTGDLSGPDWHSGSGPISAPFRYSPGGTDQHPVSIGTAQVWADPQKDAVAVTLPVTNPAVEGKSSLHVFALSLQPARKGEVLAVRGARGTTKLPRVGGQTIEATVVNLGDRWVSNVSVRAEGLGVVTLQPALVRRLAPGEEARVRIGIHAYRTGTFDGKVIASSGRVSASQKARFTLGVADYQATDASLGTHESPYWFDDAKFGIFIHWGLYSVPAWSPPGEQYAEWYWQWMQNPSNAVHAYHAATYGKDFAYDQFIPQFTASKFDPREWVRLFEEAGAKYYVLTSKHHEGFALWDSKVSGRDSVDLGPRRDLVKELFDASRKYTPSLKNGLYFSMPEWFNPDNPWRRVLADYFNKAKNRAVPKDVTVDDRCGIPTHDYTTPEYATYPNTVVKKWEASRGLDPSSYGWNRATPDSMYMTADEVIDTLADTTSKNGNFLLDIGPRADGSIPEIMQQRLRETGAWLRTNGESIYGTTYWSRMAQLGSLRFTVKPNEAFYITSLAQPGSQLVVDAPVPVRDGDRITLLGHDKPLKWTRSGGKLVVDVPAGVGQHAWVFKVALS